MEISCLIAVIEDLRKDLAGWSALALRLLPSGRERPLGELTVDGELTQPSEQRNI